MHNLFEYKDELHDKSTVSTGRFVLKTVDMADIVPNPFQKRRTTANIGSLTQSIDERGLLQPIVLTPIDRCKYSIVDGERRWRAARKAGLRQIDALIVPTSIADLEEDSLIMNLHRENIRYIDIAMAIASLHPKYSDEVLARMLGKSTTYISRARKAAAFFAAAIAAGMISYEQLAELCIPVSTYHKAARLARGAGLARAVNLITIAAQEKKSEDDIDEVIYLELVMSRTTKRHKRTGKNRECSASSPSSTGPALRFLARASSPKARSSGLAVKRSLKKLGMIIDDIASLSQKDLMIKEEDVEEVRTLLAAIPVEKLCGALQSLRRQLHVV